MNDAYDGDAPSLPSSKPGSPGSPVQDNYQMGYLQPRARKESEKSGISR